MMYPLVLDLAADGVPVTVTCRVLGFSTEKLSRPVDRVFQATSVPAC